MPSIRTLLLIIASISLILVSGGGLYEHLAVVPQWSAAPPASLAMFQGPYAVALGSFWRLIHPVTVLLLVAALVANWRTDRKKLIAIPLVAYMLLLILTAIFFVPELLSIIHTPFADSVDPALKTRADNWELYSIIRLIVLLGFNGVLLTALTRSEAKK